MSKKVLVVEDEEEVQGRYKQQLGSKVVLISALSIEEAEEQFAANPDIDAIVMDACVPGDRPTTRPLVRMIRGTFAGPMIATSGHPGYRKILVEDGCSHESSKYNLPSKLLEVLGLCE